MRAVNHYPGARDVGTSAEDNLIAGDYPSARKTVTLKGGTIYPRGAILAPLADADAGKYGLVTSDADAALVLLEQRDATAGDLTGVAAMTGDFNINAVTIGAGATLQGVKAALEPKNIYLQNSVRA